MKQIKSIILTFLAIGLITVSGFFTSCKDYLAQPPSAALPIDTVFSNITNAGTKYCFRNLATSQLLLRGGLTVSNGAIFKNENM